MAQTICEVHEENGDIVVRTFSLVTKDCSGAQCVRNEEGDIIGYKAWSKTQRVGDYDDWQIRSLVEDWCITNGIKSTELSWYEEESGVINGKAL